MRSYLVTSAFCCLAMALPLYGRELKFSEGRLYYELLFDVGVVLARNYADDHLPRGVSPSPFPTQPIDDRVDRWLHGSKHTAAQTVKECYYDELSDQLLTGLRLTSLPAVLLRPSGHRLGALMTYTHATTMLSFATTSLKILVGRPRPKLHYVHEAAQGDDRSFPSGHSGRAFVMAFAIDLVVDLPWWLRGGLYSMATAVPFTRIAAGKHFFSDTVAGVGLAYLSAYSAYRMFEYENEQQGATARKVSFDVTTTSLALTYHF